MSVTPSLPIYDELLKDFPVLDDVLPEGNSDEWGPHSYTRNAEVLETASDYQGTMTLFGIPGESYSRDTSYRGRHSHSA